jgi:hypothetical protein
MIKNGSPKSRASVLLIKKLPKTSIPNLICFLDFRISFLCQSIG